MPTDKASVDEVLPKTANIDVAGSDALAARTGGNAPALPNHLSSSTYFGWFDPLRAVLALAVFVSHSGLLPDGHPIENIGGHAVKVFFALSGFLVGGILLNKANSSTNFWSGIPKFYFNRCIRIWVPYYLMILTYLAIVVARGLWSDDMGQRLVPALTYTHNWANFQDGLSAALGPINHIWSLGVEEQFYLLCPLVAGVLRDRRLIIASMVAVTFLVPVYFDVHYYSCIALGVAAAAVHQMVPRAAWRWFQLIALYCGIPWFCMLVLWGQGMESMLMAIAATLVVVGCSAERPASGWMYLLGAMSYSFYLFHWLGLYFANPVAKRLPEAIAPIVYAVLALVLSVVVSYLSVRFIEMPLMKRRDTMARDYPWLLSTSAIAAVSSTLFGLWWIWG